MYIHLNRHAPRERVSWNHKILVHGQQSHRHAPRERVSWNRTLPYYHKILTVTLHVSVWVEMKTSLIWASRFWVTLHVSVWVEMSYSYLCDLPYNVTLHVSVWVEIFTKYENISADVSHAPRERVSWNTIIKFWLNVRRVTLHVSVWVEIGL